MAKIKFTLAARCEAAGRDNNEDNYQVVADVATDKASFVADQTLTLGAKGTLLVVCDGMGGMNAGEVASAIAVKTIKDCFCSSKISDAVLAAPEKFIKTSIQAADAAIKEHEKKNPETEGMGSTIVLVWLLKGKAYVGWCGDSRAYRYNPVSGLERLSHDHSYVQELVDAGSITEELAFFHPNNNIITRSLGDPRGAAQPDTKVFDIQKNDLFLLCSDGLCGCLQDKQILEELEQNHDNLSQCRDALWKADEAAGWHDNVTTILAHIEEGGVEPTKIFSGRTNDETVKLLNTIKYLKIALGAAALALIVVLVFWLKPCITEHFCNDEEGTSTESTENPIEGGSEEGSDVEAAEGAENVTDGAETAGETSAEAVSDGKSETESKTTVKPKGGKPISSGNGKKNKESTTSENTQNAISKQLQEVNALTSEEKQAQAEEKQIKDGGGVKTVKSDATVESSEQESVKTE